MPTNVAQFNAIVAKTVKELPPKAVSRAQRMLAMKVLRGILSKSLVRTGRSRGAWLVAVGAPATGEPTGTGFRSPGQVQSIASAVLAQLPPYSVVWLSNNVNYISHLEYGTDRMPPVAMVARTIAEFVNANLDKLADAGGASYAGAPLP